MRSWSWWGHSKKRPGVWGRSRSISWKRHLRPWKRRGSRRTAWDESSPHFPSTPLTLLATSSYSWMTAGMERRTKWEERRRRWTVGIITPKGWRETGAPHPETVTCSSDLRRLGWWPISWVSCTCQTARNSSSSCCRWGNLSTSYMLLTYFMSCCSIFITLLDTFCELFGCFCVFLPDLVLHTLTYKYHFANWVSDACFSYFDNRSAQCCIANSTLGHLCQPVI